MSEVYIAHDTRLKRPVALKLLLEKYCEDDELLKRFQQEAFAASALNHPHIITVYDIGNVEGRHFIATEFLQGETLRQLIDRGQQPVNDALDIAIQVADALKAAHNAIIVHRDVKPENIILRVDGYVKLLDFGIAKLISGQPELRVKTFPGVLIGTPMYMSPEQARGEPVNASTDVWSLGVVLYEMLSGRTPFTGSTVGEIVRSIQQDEPRPLSSFRNDISTELQFVINTALAKNSADRYQDAGELLLAFKELKQTLDSPLELRGSGKDPSSPKKYFNEYKSTLRDVNQPPHMATGSKRSSGRRHSRTAIRSIAILPFKNESSNSKTEYLSDGVTETIINNLSQLPQLRVMSRSSVFHFKGSREDPRSIGNQLGVSAVLTGRLLKVASKLVIQTELVDVVDGSQIWGDRFNRSMSDIFEIQDQIAKEISQKLELKLSPRQKKRISKRPTVNEQAYLSYLKGRFQWNKRSAEALALAVDYFHEAIETEPLYALAFTGLADSYVALGALHAMPSHDAYTKARAAAIRALELDSSMAEAYATLGFIMATYDRNWSGSEQSFQKALALNPNYATAHQWYSVVLRSLGRVEEAIEESLKADELDPLSPIINATVGQSYYFARQYDAAIKRYSRMLSIQSGYHWSHYFLGCAYRQKKEYDKAISEFDEALDKMPRDPVIISDLAYTLAISGRLDLARVRVAEMEEIARRVYVSPYDLAVAYLGLGEKERALDLLDQAYREHDDGLLMIKIDPLLDPLRDDQRFKTLILQVGLG